MKTEKQMAAPTDYIKKMKKRDPELSKGWGQIVTPLSVQTARGKQKVNCAPREGIFRIIQAIPSPIYDRCQSLVNFEAAITALGLSGEELTFVGHSLGGGLAALSSRHTGRDAITFNPASLSGGVNALSSVVSLFRGGHITQYRSYGNGLLGGPLGDPVNFVQDLAGKSSQGKVIPVYVGKNFSHRIEGIINAFHRNGIR